jgi:iron complex outermembrane receptor protein
MTTAQARAAYLFLLSLAGSSAVWVGAGAQQRDAHPAHVERIEVTGTNLPRADVEGALPLQVITREEMLRGGVASAQDLVDRISAHQSFGGVSESGQIGTPGANKGWGYTAASLRGLGAQRTLVLLNGRRLAPYAMSGSIGTDLSAIPLSAIERVEILKDGASAVYGTDAIGGVINFILRRDYRGFEVAANYLKTQQGGGDSWRANIAAGWGNLDRDGYNAFLFADHQRQGVLKAADRESTRTGYRPDLALEGTSGRSFPANFTQPSPIPGAPPLIAAARNPTIPSTGATADSCLPPFSFPTLDFPRQCRFDATALIDTIPASDKTNLFARFDSQLRADHRFFAEAAYYHGYSIQHLAPTPVSSDLPTRTPMTLPPSSPYYPADFVRSIGGDPALPLELRYRAVELGPRVIEIRMDQARAVTGLQGWKGGWDHQAAVSFVANRQVSSYVTGLVSEAAFGPLLRSGVINPFGPNTADVLQQMRATQVSGRESDNRASHYGGDIKVSRDLMTLPAGPLAVALGLEGRRERLEMINAEFLYTGDIIGGNGALPSFSASSRKVGSFFAEAGIPIVASLEANVAVRADHYSDFGTTVNPKLSVRWVATKEALVRASYGTGFRAPTLYELYLPPYTEGFLTDAKDPVRCPVTHSDDDCKAELRVVNGGNLELTPERSRQLNIGFVLEPMRMVSLSVDYYRVDLRNVIAPVTLQAALATYNVRKPPDPEHPALPGPIDYLRNGFFNVVSLQTSGLDVDARWSVPTEAGRLTLSLTGTYVLTYRPDEAQTDGGSPASAGRRSAASGAIAPWRHYAAIDWNHGAWGTTLAQTFQSGYYEPDPHFEESPGDRRVGSYSVFDFQARYTGIPKLTLALGIRNFMATVPPASSQSGAFVVGIDPLYADPRGRMWYGTVRYSFR